MTREIIENYRFIVIPYVVNRLKEINYDGQGNSDAKEFMRDFNEIFDLAIKALEQEPCCNCIEFKRYAKEMGFEIEQEPKSEWEQDHATLKAYSDGVNEVLDMIRAEINTMPCAVTSMKEIYVNRDKVINIIDKYKGESV